ncbi:MAG: Holliday junction resolvase RuvX, partial [Rudaea sp.]
VGPAPCTVCEPGSRAAGWRRIGAEPAVTYLSLDVGERRVGVAVGSTEVRLATPLTVLVRATPKSDAARMLDLARQYDVLHVIVGLPRELNGDVGTQAQRVMQYVDRLRSLVPLSFEYFDERFSTAHALARRREMGVSEKQGRATIDAAAAAVILQDFFDAMPSSTPSDVE